MNQLELMNAVYELSNTSSRTEKKEIIRENFADSEYAVAILAGQRFDDLGIGKKTFEKACDSVFDVDFDEYQNYVEALRSGTNDLRSVQSLYEDVSDLKKLGGHEQRDHLEYILSSHNPPAVAFTVLRSKSGVFSTGVTENTIAKSFCEPKGIDYNRALGLEPDVASLVEKIQNGEGDFQPTVGKAFKPMLAKNKDLPTSDDHSFNCQMKIDGYRLLVHVDNENGYPKIAAYTRRLNEVTNSLPELQEIDWPEGKYIFDAEVIAEDGSYKSTSERVGSKEFNRDQEMNFKCFDLVVDDGEDISQRNYYIRYKRLKKLVDEITDQRLSRLENHGLSEGIQLAEERGHEGIIAKDVMSGYKFNKRSSAWRKSKNTAETVDVRVSGFEEGEGKFTGMLGKVYVESADGVQLGAVGTGFTDSERDDIWQNKDDWSGSVIEVTAEAYDDSLRFPAFERRRDDDGVADTSDRIQELLPDDA